MSIRSTLIAVFTATGVTLSGGLAHATDNADQAREEIQEAWEAIQDYSVERKDQAIEKAEELIDTLDARIEELSDEAADASGEARESLDERIEDLKELRADAADKLEDLREGTVDTWDRVKASFGDAVDAFRTRWNEATDYECCQPIESPGPYRGCHPGTPRSARAWGRPRVSSR